MVRTSLIEHRTGRRVVAAPDRGSLQVCIVFNIALSATIAAMMTSPLSVASMTSPLLTWDGNKVTCHPEKGDVDDWIGLVPQQNEVTFACEGKGVTPVPKNLVNSKSREVCAQGMSANACEKDPRPLSEILKGAQNDWLNGEDLSRGITFRVPKNNFPGLPRIFRIGCRTRSNICMISLHIYAKSAYTSGQVTECAYESNVSLPPVRITPATNHATIVCGPYGGISPLDYKKEFCTGEPHTSCGRQKYADVLPRYTDAWWNGDPSTAEGATLTVPNGHFPKETQTLKFMCLERLDTQPRRCVVTVEIAAGVSGSKPSGGESIPPQAPGTEGSRKEAPNTNNSGGTPTGGGSDDDTTPPGTGSSGTDSRGDLGDGRDQDAKGGMSRGNSESGSNGGATQPSRLLGLPSAVIGTLAAAMFGAV
ncbi:SAG-related sequence SRS29A [Toxoplasma gondii VEG]|uniref:SRS29A n=1 Tax=Toxoplasma gondii (strain ATCC 50861 / VEG) TaxID=432359 RepID=B9Q4G2_TOXGV|nr:SAG-related sequence SRS29A [Toxoplasma gondii VEG]CEL75006.1 TPA: SRS29A [Toxoplasma gondii VEG]